MIEEKLDLGEMGERQKKLFLTSVFLGKMLAAGAVFQVVLHIYPSTFGIQAGFARLVADTLKLLGVDATTNMYFVVLDTGIYRITQDCLGWKSIAAFTGLMFASGSLKKHYRFLLAGIGVLVVANVVRVVSTVYLSHTGVISFDIIHGTLWKWGLTSLVLVMWFYWFHGENHELF
ncbi:MAG: archaeosortase/exosortase family protein [Candidatus Nanohaloarchaea archaeon]